MSGPLALYDKRVIEGVLSADEKQREAVKTLQLLYEELCIVARTGKDWMSWLRKLGRQSDTGPQGIYMYGDVGRGKSMLMDLFYECIPPEITKRRVHFHAFMIEVHDYFHSRRKAGDVDGGVDALIPSLAALVKSRSNVLCFDEFHVTDVADAMILGRLFSELLSLGVVVISTSNWPPERLYEGGLQRDRFIPFIELIKARMHVVHLDHETDYRAQCLIEEGSYFYPLNSDAHDKLVHLFERMTMGRQTYREFIEVKGRKIVASRVYEDIARFSFAELCEMPHGAEDFLAVAERYKTVFIENIPKLTYDRRNETKRFMILIDALYEAKARVVVSADAAIDELYMGHDYEFEFQRTASRLKEMGR